MGFKNFPQNHVMLFTEKHLKLTTFDWSCAYNATTLAELLTSNSLGSTHEKNSREQPTFFFLVYNRNFQSAVAWEILDIKSGKLLVVPKDFFHGLNQLNWMLVIRLMLWSSKHTNLAKILDQSSWRLSISSIFQWRASHGFGESSWNSCFLE